MKKVIRNIKNLVFNKNRYLFEKEIFKKARISYVPDQLIIHVTFRCNLRCPTCLFLLKDPKAFDTETTKDMNMEDFVWILNRLKGKVEGIHFGGGESLLHPKIYEMAKEVKKRGLWLGISTNGILVKDRIEALKFFNRINISLDGADYEDFKKIRNGTPEQYKAIIEGMHWLNRWGIKFQISFLLFEEAIDKIPKILEFALEKKPGAISFRTGNPRGHKEWTPLMAESPKVQQFLRNILSRSDYPFSIRLPQIYEDTPEFLKHKCPKTWETTYIGCNGDIAQCCYNKPNPILGNIFEGYNFNSSAMMKLRQDTIENIYPSDCKYCRRRVKKVYWGWLNSKTKTWNFSPAYKRIIKTLLVKQLT